MRYFGGAKATLKRSAPPRPWSVPLTLRHISLVTYSTYSEIAVTFILTVCNNIVCHQRSAPSQLVSWLHSFWGGLLAAPPPCAKKNLFTHST
jgi:hypothetical protein